LVVWCKVCCPLLLLLTPCSSSIECSTGVDPVARREIWAMISNMVSGSVQPGERPSVILTTHRCVAVVRKVDSLFCHSVK
jgi:hypothetical protein